MILGKPNWGVVLQWILAVLLAALYAGAGYILGGMVVSVVSQVLMLDTGTALISFFACCWPICSVLISALSARLAKKQGVFMRALVVVCAAFSSALGMTLLSWEAHVSFGQRPGLVWAAIILPATIALFWHVGKPGLSDENSQRSS